LRAWINGAFGAGKTTLAEELHRRLPETILYDPEYVGYGPRAPQAPCRDAHRPDDTLYTQALAWISATSPS
jgi:Mg-chelatase subunit ChlI